MEMKTTAIPTFVAGDGGGGDRWRAYDFIVGFFRIGAPSEKEERVETRENPNVVAHPSNICNFPLLTRTGV